MDPYLTLVRMATASLSERIVRDARRMRRYLDESLANYARDGSTPTKSVIERVNAASVRITRRLEEIYHLHDQAETVKKAIVAVVSQMKGKNISQEVVDFLTDVFTFLPIEDHEDKHKLVYRVYATMKKHKLDPFKVA